MIFCVNVLQNKLISITCTFIANVEIITTFSSMLITNVGLKSYLLQL